jgi:hypothetical protein
MAKSIAFENGFSRYHKYTLGTELRNLSREIVRLVIKANSERDRMATSATLAQERGLVVRKNKVRFFQ